MAKKAKNRGVKPGTKRGPYKKRRNIIEGLKEAINNKAGKVGDVVTFDTGSLPSLISDLASTIDNLEAQLTAQIDRIKSILI